MRRAWRERWSDDGGFSIVEIIVASMILAVGILALASTAIPSVRALHVAEGRQAASAAATQALELARQLPYDELALLNSAFSDGTHDPDGPGPLTAERLARDPAGAIDRVLPYWGVNGDGIDLETRVTLWCDDSSDPCNSVGEEDGRRVTVTARWRTGNGLQTVRTGTIIARSQR